MLLPRRAACKQAHRRMVLKWALPCEARESTLPSAPARAGPAAVEAVAVSAVFAVEAAVVVVAGVTGDSGVAGPDSARRRDIGPVDSAMREPMGLWGEGHLTPPAAGW